jgi:hypothetical protein
MERKEVVEEVKEYFSDSDHWRRLCASLQEPEPQLAHIHAYVETSVHPASLEALIVGYFERMGWPSTRRIDHMSPRPPLGSLHGIEPRGKPHFDFHWIYRADVGIRPTEGGESGCNLLVWNRWYIESFCKRFKFRDAGPREHDALRDYFRSDHFMRGLEIAKSPSTTHMHININTSIHPNEIQRHAEEALSRMGWRIDYTCPNVYMVKGRYRGKLVFMGRDPEVVFDIGWNLKPEVIIEPALEKWIFEEEPGYDVWTKAMLDEVMKEDYITLTEGEIDYILRACFED